MPKSLNLTFLTSKSLPRLHSLKERAGKSVIRGLFSYQTLISAKPVLKLGYILRFTLAPHQAPFIFNSTLFKEIFLYLSTVLSSLKQNMSLGEIKGGFTLNSLNGRIP